jgi:prevent-host-death family protein
MKTLTAKDAKYGFGRLIDLARAEPVMIAKHGRPVVVVMAVEEYDRIVASTKKGLILPRGRNMPGVSDGQH